MPTAVAAPGHFLRETVSRVRDAGPTGQLTLRADSGFYSHGVVAMCRRLKVRYSITIRQHRSVRTLIEAIPDEAWTAIPYWIDGGADVAETVYTPFAGEKGAVPVRLIVRRVKPTPGSQLALFTLYDFHAFITDRDGDMLALEADHRRHAEVENAIRDLKEGVGLKHLPSGRFAANGAWLAIAVMAHNVSRWTARIGLGEGILTTRITPSAAVRAPRAAHPLGPKDGAPPAGALAMGGALPRRPCQGPGHPHRGLTRPDRLSRCPGTAPRHTRNERRIFRTALRDPPPGVHGAIRDTDNHAAAPRCPSATRSLRSRPLDAAER